MDDDDDDADDDDDDEDDDDDDDDDDVKCSFIWTPLLSVAPALTGEWRPHPWRTWLAVNRC